MALTPKIALATTLCLTLAIGLSAAPAHAGGELEQIKALLATQQAQIAELERRLEAERAERERSLDALANAKAESEAALAARIKTLEDAGATKAWVAQQGFILASGSSIAVQTLYDPYPSEPEYRRAALNAFDHCREQGWKLGGFPVHHHNSPSTRHVVCLKPFE